jgi:hypothetical protein
MKSALGAILCILCLAHGALAQDLYVPPPEPEKRPDPPPKPVPVVPKSIDGTWRFQSDCDTGQYKGTLEFAGSGGTLDGAVDGTLSSVKVSGSKVSFTNSYSLFGRVTEQWSGQLSKDHSSISGDLNDSNGDHCVFVLQRMSG